MKTNRIFALTVLATRIRKDAYQGESFAFIGFSKNHNTPSMPINDAHLEGFFFLNQTTSNDL